jgi:N-acetylmuramoyl-L-alanine amidase
MFTLSGHRLTGDSPQGIPVRYVASLNHGGVIQPKFLVFHYTACTSEAARAIFLRQTGSNRVSAHVLVDPDGCVTQFVDFNLRAWHAGASRWDGFQDLNTHSIGIEVVNFGYLLKTAAGVFRTAEGLQQVPESEVVEARHRLPQWPWQYWQAYTPEQIGTCEALAELLAGAYGLRDVVGHEDIAPERKADPGPAFPLPRVRSRALGRDTQEVDAQQVAYVAVDKLNIRNGPGTRFDTARAPLVRNTQLKVLQRDASGWLQVDTAQQHPVIGWVWAEYTGEQVT